MRLQNLYADINTKTNRTGGLFLQLTPNTNQPSRLMLGNNMKAITRDWQLYLLLFLPMAYFIIFKYVPMLGVVVAFKDYNIFKGVLESEWIGFAAFREIFQMDAFYNALRNTFV